MRKGVTAAIFGIMCIPILSIGSAQPVCEPGSETFDEGGCAKSMIKPIQWKADAMSTGISCDGKNFKLADGTDGPHFSTWILVEDDLAKNLEALALIVTKDVYIGWNWVDENTYDAATVDITDRDAYGNILHWRFTTEATIQGMCAGWHGLSTVGGTDAWTESWAVLSSFSGAKVTYVQSGSDTITWEVHANVDYQWSFGLSKNGVSVTTPKISFGGSWTHTSTSGWSVTFASTSKTVGNGAIVSAGSVVPVNLLDPIAYDGSGILLCAGANGAGQCGDGGANELLAY